MTAPSFKCGVKVSGEDKLNFNQLVFATKEEAISYGRDLMSRWMAMTGYEAVESEEPVTHAWTATGLHEIKTP